MTEFSKIYVANRGEIAITADVPVFPATELLGDNMTTIKAEAA